MEINTYIKLSRVVDNYGTVTVKAVDDLENVISSGSFEDAHNALIFMKREKRKPDCIGFIIENYNENLRDNAEKLTKLVNKTLEINSK